MAYCRNCGKELPDGVKFCENCGTKVEISGTLASQNMEGDFEEKDVNPAGNSLKDTEDDYDYNYEYIHDPESYKSYSGQKGKNVKTVTNFESAKNDGAGNGLSVLDRFGKFYGILLIILDFVNLGVKIPFLTVLLALLVIAGCIFCFARKYKLRFFTVIALILAVLCFIFGISDCKEDGLFNNKKDSYESISDEYASSDIAVERDYAADQDEEETVPEAADEIQEQAGSREMDETVTEEAEETVQEDNADESSAAEDEAVSGEDTTGSTGVDPDLKAFLDSYEAFMDEYVEFMQKYKSDPSNAVSMMNDYLTIMTKYEEFAQKADAYDQDEMSKEDLAYYLDAMNRIEKKLLEAAY